jgi:CSLREA domain-containing protein
MPRGASLTRRLAAVVVAIAVLALPAGALANTITVSTQTDEKSGGNGCSLREAVIAANANSTGPGGDCAKGAGADTISVPASNTHYKLTIAGVGEDAAAKGDLDITGAVTITGAGAGKTIVDGNGIDRVFENRNSAHSELRDLTVTGGKTQDGAPGTDAGPTLPGVDSNGTDGGDAPDVGGGIYNNQSTLTLTGVVVSGNTAGHGGRGGNGGDVAGGAGGNSTGGAGGSGAPGGGVASSKGTLTIVSSRIVGNTAGGGGAGGTAAAAGAGSTGGTGGPGGDSSGGRGGGGAPGGGIWLLDAGSASITGSVVADDKAGAGGNGGNAGNGGAGGVAAGGTGGRGGNSTGGDGGDSVAGGGIHASGPTVDIEDSTVAGNDAAPAGAGGNGGHGGAGGTGAPDGDGGSSKGGSGGAGSLGGGAFVLVGFGTFGRVRRSAITNNASGPGGAGGDAGTGGSGSTGGSTTGGDGGDAGGVGGLFLGAGNASLLSSTVAANRAGAGGAGGAAGTAGSGSAAGTPTATAGKGGKGGSVGGVTAGGADIGHTTIARNKVGAGGSGSPAGAPGATGGLLTIAPVTLRNSIVALNDDGQCDPTFGAITEAGKSLSFPDALNKCSATLRANPLLSALGNHGGPTATLALLPGSPAIDVTSALCEATDQRGVTRPKGTACDAGAVERSAPAATTGRASAVTTTRAKVAGSANGGELAASYRFQCGKTRSYGSQTPAVKLAASTSAAAVQATLKGLKPNTTYHYRLVVTNADGTARGADRTFKTKLPRFAGARVVTKSAKVRKGRVRLKVACPRLASKRCTGSLRLTARVSKTVKFGARGFRVAAGRSKFVRVKLSGLGRRVVRNKKRVTARARARSVDARGGKPVVKTTKVRLRA